MTTATGPDDKRDRGLRCTCSPSRGACPTPDECDLWAWADKDQMRQAEEIMADQYDPPPSDEAREAAVEAVAQRLSADYDSARAWAKGDEVYRDSWRDDARELLLLPEVTAWAGGAPVMCDGGDGRPATVTGLLFDGERDVPANYCDDCADVCQRHTDFRLTGTFPAAGQDGVSVTACTHFGHLTDTALTSDNDTGTCENGGARPTGGGTPAGRYPTTDHTGRGLS